MDVETFMHKIGGDCHEFADKFESIEEILKVTPHELKFDKEIPVVQRKYLMSKQFYPRN